MKQLTKNQIQELFAFTKSHRVRYYDLQSEVVDHLASAIEAKWAENPDIPFKQALKETHASFGVYGFGKLEQEKREAIQRKIGWKIWAYLKVYFTLPKILTTLLLIILTQQGLSMLENPYVISKYIAYMFILSMFGFVEFRKRKIKDLLDKYLEINVVYTMGFPGIVVSTVLADLLMFGGDYPSIILWILATWLVLALIAAVGTYDYLVKTVEEVKLRYERN